MICNKESIGRAKKKNGSRYEYKAKFFDFPEFWLNNPGDLLLAGPPDRVQGRPSPTAGRGADVKFKVA